MLTTIYIWELSAHNNNKLVTFQTIKTYPNPNCKNLKSDSFLVKFSVIG